MSSNVSSTAFSTHPIDFLISSFPTIVYAQKIYKILQIFFTDILPTTLTCVLPNACRFAYRLFCSKSIQSYTLQAKTVNKTAHLFFHDASQFPLGNRIPALLLLHGDHSHPLTLLHLADIAKKEGRAVFSIHLPYDDTHPEHHRTLLKNSIAKIKEIIRENGGSLSHLILAGHSRGALEAADAAYVRNYQEIKGIIAIAGRFQVTAPSLRPCRNSLKPSVQLVSNALSNFRTSLRVPFYQIAAKNDWCIDLNASIARTDYPHVCIDSDHLSVICHPNTLKHFQSYI